MVGYINGYIHTKQQHPCVTTTIFETGFRKVCPVMWHLDHKVESLDCNVEMINTIEHWDPALYWKEGNSYV